MKKKRLQIDVMGESHIEYLKRDEPVRCKLYIDGNATDLWISRFSYQTLVRDGFFVRDGKDPDSSGAVNTTAVYLEKATPGI
jgi:hypothetical protein